MGKCVEMKTLKEWDAKPGDVVTAVGMINTGHVIENGVSWIIKSFDGNDFFGVLDHYKDDHKWVKLSNYHLWDIKRVSLVVQYTQGYKISEKHGRFTPVSDLSHGATHVVTFILIDGVPDCNSVKMVKL